MRDPKRIRPFLQVLATLWEKYSDMRFGQLVDNILYCRHAGDSLFYVEDDTFLELIKKYMEETNADTSPR